MNAKNDSLNITEQQLRNLQAKHLQTMESIARRTLQTLERMEVQIGRYVAAILDEDESGAKK